MKFMKLGSKPDTFQSDDGNLTRYVSSDLATDVIVNIGHVRFCLHRFPLLSKSNLLHKLVQNGNDESSDEIAISSFPGGPRAFEICAKFCYGMTVTLNAYNVVAARCAAEYLEMTEDMDRGNLIFKIEVFLTSSIFHSWKDSIHVLQSTKNLQPWAEDLNIVGRSIDSIASKTSVNPVNVTWSYVCNRKLALADEITENGSRLERNVEPVPKDWWVEDICELEIDLYKRVILAVKSKGRMDSDLIGEALKSYAVKWLPDTFSGLGSEDHTRRNKTLVETIICLLPSDKIAGCTCSFLLKLLKVAILVGADESSTEDLVHRISLKLDQALVKDLLIPARTSQTTIYDVDLVMSIITRFMTNMRQLRDMQNADMNLKESGDFIVSHGSLLNVGYLIDGYLAEIGCDPNLALSTFIDLLQLISESERPSHDGMYRAIDIYLKEHPSLTKEERKKICGLINVKKLSINASMHAAQNERLPLRMVVQVLFFEQIRAAASAAQTLISNSTATNTDEESEKAVPEKCKSLNNQMCQVKIKDEEFRKTVKLAKKNSKRGSAHAQLLPSRSRRIFDKLWIVGNSHNKGNVEHRSSETSGSSRSPTASVAPAETKSSGSSSLRHRRHSIS